MSSRLGNTGEFITGRQINLAAMDIHFQVFKPKYQYFEKFFEGTLFRIKFAITFPQYVL